MNSRGFIIDTNVMVAGLITDDLGSPTARILDSMLNGSIIFLLSPELLHEYQSVLLRPKLSQRHGLNETEIEQILSEITANAIWREPPPDPAHSPPDPQDAHLWALLASEATAILVTGDRRLVENPRPQSSVISPATWAKQFSEPR
jgi:putative PIN family toxin of toxin-antitoxin system